MNICHKAVEAWDRLLHRSVAALLAAAMTLSFLPATSWAVSPITPPTQITEATKSEFPKIEFQTNFVRTEYGSLTGLMELAIRVGPSGTTTVDGKEVAVPVDFQSVAATLQYNTTLFQPISWQWAFGEMGEATPIDIDLKTNVTSYYDVQIPAKKDDSLPGTGAIAQCGVVDPAPTGMSTNVTSGEQALLFFKAEAYGPAITIAEMTTLAVVRFYVNPALMEHISILRDKVTGDYSVLFDGKKAEADWITDQARLDAAIKTVATTGGTVTPDPDPTSTPDPTPSTRDTATLTLPTDFISVGFAMDGDMARSQSPADMSLHYSTGGNEFYYVPGCDPTEPDPDKNDKLENVPTELGPKGSQVTVDLPAPKTDGERVLAVAENAPTDSTNAADYSYLSNLIPAANISFPVVSQLSFADNGDGRENMATVLFYDWDDTLIGVLVVPRNDDARALVNEYVRDNMIHPDLRFTVGSTTQTTDITSLARQDTYRGKYPSTPMADGGKDTTMDGNRPATPEGNDKLVGSDYPLTNKLDYVFLKRPMTQTAKGETATGEPTSTWTQPGTTGNVEWDDEYPYIHGWALIPDKDLTDIVYTHPNNVWTTIGMGELNDYNGAHEGGYNDITGTPGVLNVEGLDLVIADFNFHENVLAKGSVYAVKAIYEPGEKLLTSLYAYRMIHTPYYNKLNVNASNSGGAYSVDLQYERASTNADNTVRGVARIRDIIIRQDSTTDLLWEDKTLTKDSLVARAMLSNATKYEANNSKTKTSYVPIQVDNGDELSFSLTLSARFHRIDYYVNDKYGSNFVSGKQRMGGNEYQNTSLGNEYYVLENYNYFNVNSTTGETESDTKDIYYDVLYYGEREGSRGFVLYGTINNIMEYATYNVKDSANTDFFTYASYATMNDMNLRTAGGDIGTFDNEGTLQTDVLSAAKWVLDNTSPTNPEYWNVEKGLIELSYHQLQLYIMNPGAGVLTKSAADAKTISWCNLHETCAATRSGKPTDFKTMVEAALKGTVTEAEETIQLLELVTALDFIYLRDSSGQAYTTKANFAKDFVAAVRGLNAISPINTSDPNLLVNYWDAIQGWILAETAPTTIAGAQQVSKDKAWWYDSTKSCGSASMPMPVANLAGVMDAAKKANELNRDAWLNFFSGRFPNGWVALTKNLMADCDVANNYEATPFASYDAFKTAIKKVEKNLTIDANWDEKTLWDQVQFYLINDRAATGSADDTTQISNYWWYNGATRVTDVSSLLTNAAGKTEAWTNFKFEDLYHYVGLNFRSDFRGVKYEADPTDGSAKDPNKKYFSDFKIIIEELAKKSTTYTWQEVQYYLIHNEITFDIANEAETDYYWWTVLDGDKKPTAISTGQSVDFSTITDYNNGITVFLDAAFRYEINGNELAWNGLTAAFDKVKAARLIKKDNAATTFDTLEHFATAADFMAAINGIAAKAGGKAPAPGQALVLPQASWQQVQYYLLNGKSFVDSTTADGEDYWWRTQDDKNTTKQPAEYFAEMQTKLQELFDSYDGDAFDSSAVDDWLCDLDNLNAVFSKSGGASFTATDVNRLRRNLEDMWWSFIDGGFTSASQISWYQLQYAILEYEYSFEDDSWVVDEYLVPGDIAIPDWVPAAATVLSLRKPARQPKVDVETDADTGITTTTTPDTITELPNGLTQVQRTITVLSPEGEILEITTLVEIYDADYNLISSQTVTMPVTGQLEEPVCTCGSEDGTHAEDCPLYVPPAETEEPTESPEPAESVEPSESPEATAAPEPSESPEATVAPEPTVSPEPTESSSPEEELPEPSTPGAETPEVPPTPEPAESETPDGPVGPQESESPEVTVTPEPTPTPEGTLETMPEIIDPDPPASEPPGGSEEETADGSAGTEETTTSPPPSQEAVVIETQPPLVGTINLRSHSAPMVYRKLTTKIAPTKLFTSAGGRNMKQLKLNRIFSPPGRPLSGAVPLRLRTETEERRCAV